MAKTPRRKKSSTRALIPIHPDTAGLDVGSTFHVVAVPSDRDADPVRSFKSFTGDLHALADWLESVGIRSIAMESTGVYWVPVFEILEARGFDFEIRPSEQLIHLELIAPHPRARDRGRAARRVRRSNVMWR